MRFGVTLPNLGVPNGPAQLVELAAAAERAGWDGVFVWDTVWSPDWHAEFEHDAARQATWDPWVLLAAMAVATHDVRLGTIVTPLSRRRPWKVAAETVTIDHLSGGRLTLAVSLGWQPDGGFDKVNEESDRGARAERLDETLAILGASWRGESVEHDGCHYQIRGLPGTASVQQPRIPIWVVGAWPAERSLARAFAFDGMLPAVRTSEYGWLQPSPDQLEPIAAMARARTRPGYDIVVEGNTSRDPDTALERITPYEAAGATWWLEGVWSFLHDAEHGLDRMRARIDAGPPTART